MALFCATSAPVVVASGVCSNEKLIKRFQITSTYCCSMHATFLAFRNCLQSQCIWNLLEKKRARKIGKKDPFWRTIFLSQDLLNLTAIYCHFPLHCPQVEFRNVHCSIFLILPQQGWPKFWWQIHIAQTITYHLKSIHSKQF